MALLDDNFGRLVHGLCTQAIVELPVRDADIGSERGCMQQQRCGSPSGVWHPFSLQTFALHRREDGNYHRVLALQEAASRAARCKLHVPSRQPSQEVAFQLENGSMEARGRREKAVKRSRMVIEAEPTPKKGNFGHLWHATR